MNISWTSWEKLLNQWFRPVRISKHSPWRQSPASSPGVQECSRPCPRTSRAPPCRRTCSKPRHRQRRWYLARRRCPAVSPLAPRRSGSLEQGSRTRPCPAGSPWCAAPWNASRRLRSSTSRRQSAWPRPWCVIPGTRAETRRQKPKLKRKRFHIKHLERKRLELTAVTPQESEKKNSYHKNLTCVLDCEYENSRFSYFKLLIPYPFSAVHSFIG